MGPRTIAEIFFGTAVWLQSDLPQSPQDIHESFSRQGGFGQDYLLHVLKCIQQAAVLCSACQSVGFQESFLICAGSKLLNNFPTHLIHYEKIPVRCECFTDFRCFIFPIA